MKIFFTITSRGSRPAKNLAGDTTRTPSTIHRIVHDNIRHPIVIPKHKNVVVLMDTTYWGWDFGVVVAKDALRDVVLWHKYIYRHEHWTDYAEGYEYLKKHGFHIKGIVVDGLNGLFKAFDHTPIQMCQVHRQRIIRTYLTSDPDLEASKELLRISKLLTCTDMESFIGIFEEWCAKWKSFLNERSHDSTTGKTRYAHAKLRSAYNSLRKHMPWLWTFYKYPTLGIPNTNNGIGSTFTDIKKHTRSHTGLSGEQREKFLDELIAGKHAQAAPPTEYTASGGYRWGAAGSSPEGLSLRPTVAKAHEKWRLQTVSTNPNAY